MISAMPPTLENVHADVKSFKVCLKVCMYVYMHVQRLNVCALLTTHTFTNQVVCVDMYIPVRGVEGGH
jgi:hypothetical protein